MRGVSALLLAAAAVAPAFAANQTNDGLKNVKQVKAPQKTIDSTKELKNLVPGKAQKSLDRKNTHGLYT